MAKIANQFSRHPIMRVTATEAKNRFGMLCTQAKREPVFVEKAGRLDTVILSADQYLALRAVQGQASRAARKQVFEAEFGEWIAAQNARAQAQGIPGAKLLRQPLANVADQASALVAAVDAVMSGI